MILYRLRARRSQDASERGSISSWLITGAFVLILGVGIAVDLTGQVHALTRANSIANQAARAGGQQLAQGTALQGGAVQIDAGQAAQAAHAYLASAGMTGTVQVHGGAVITVTAADTYETKFLSIIGLSTMSVEGQGESRSVRVVGGSEG